MASQNGYDRSRNGNHRASVTEGVGGGLVHARAAAAPGTTVRPIDAAVSKRRNNSVGGRRNRSCPPTTPATRRLWSGARHSRGKPEVLPGEPAVADLFR